MISSFNPLFTYCVVRETNKPLPQPLFEAPPEPAQPLASLGRTRRCQDAEELLAPWSFAPEGSALLSAPSSCQQPACPVEKGWVVTLERRCQHLERMWSREAWRDQGDVAPKLLQPFSAPFPLLAAASEPPPVEGEEMLASQEGVEMMRAEASRKRHWKSSSPWTAPGLQGGGVGEDASG